MQGASTAIEASKLSEMEIFDTVNADRVVAKQSILLVAHVEDDLADIWGLKHSSEEDQVSFSDCKGCMERPTVNGRSKFDQTYH